MSKESPESDLDSSNQRHNDSHVSGISPFLSAEDIVVQLNGQPPSKVKKYKFLWNR